MDIGRPYRTVVATVDGDVLAQLSRSSKPRTGRELARMTRRSEAGVRSSVSRLVDQGLVLVEDTAAGRLFTLNRDHVAAPVVERLAELRVELFERLRSRIRAWSLAPVHASVFGSAVRADGDSGSDVDIFIVRARGIDPDDEGWRAQLDELADAVYRWSGNHAGLSEVSEEDLPRLRRERPPVIEDLVEHSVHLAGVDTRRVLGAGR